MTAYSVTGDRLMVYGTQRVSVTFRKHCSLIHEFLVANLQMSCDGILGMDILRRIGAKIDISEGTLFVDNHVFGAIHESSVKLSGCGEIEQVPLSPVNRDETPVTLRCSSGTWPVVNTQEMSCPPMSEVLIQGRLDMKTQNREGIPQEVLVEPVELNIHGLRVARVLSHVSESNSQVIMKVINFSRENLILPKKCVLGMAEACPAYLEDTENSSYSRKLRVRGIRHERFGNKVNKGVLVEIKDKLKHLSDKEREVLWPVLCRYAYIFGEPSEKLGCHSKIQHKIETGDHPPIKKNPYRLPHALRPVVEEQINDMLQKGIIRPSTSPWSSPVVIVSKKSPDGSPKYRFCVDYRALNSITRGDAYPLPNIVETLDCLHNSVYFTTLDLCSGFHQVSVSPEDCRENSV